MTYQAYQAEYSDNQLEMSKATKCACSKENFNFFTTVKTKQNKKQQMYIMEQAQSISGIWQNSNF